MCRGEYTKHPTLSFAILLTRYRLTTSEMSISFALPTQLLPRPTQIAPRVADTNTRPACDRAIAKAIAKATGPR